MPNSAAQRYLIAAAGVINRIAAEESATISAVGDSIAAAITVEKAKRARELGATVVAVTSSAYRDVPLREEIGARLTDFADAVLDTKVPVGDAVLHALVAGIIDGLQAHGITPPVFLSANLDGGAEWNETQLAKHRDRIFYLD